LSVGVLLALGGAIAFSIMNVAIRKGVRVGDADNGVVTTVLINVVAFTVLMALVLPTRGLTWSWAGVGAFAAAGLMSTYIGRTLLFTGIRHAGAARAAAVKNATPLFTLIIAVAILGERIVPLAGLGIGLVLVGILVLGRESLRRPVTDEGSAARTHPVELALESEAIAEGGLPDGIRSDVGSSRASPDGPDDTSAAAGRARRSMLFGLTLAAIAAVIFGAGHALRKVGMDIVSDALLGALVGAWAALIAHLATAVVRGRWTTVRTAVMTRRPYFWLAGITGTIGQLCFFAALAFAPVSHVSVVAASETILTVLLAGLVAQGTERITVRIAVPAVLVFVGVAAIALSR
jgi:drug/metabolite transporter (DMT)-like permease